MDWTGGLWTGHTGTEIRIKASDMVCVLVFFPSRGWTEMEHSSQSEQLQVCLLDVSQRRSPPGRIIILLLLLE